MKPILGFLWTGSDLKWNFGILSVSMLTSLEYASPQLRAISFETVYTYLKVFVQTWLTLESKGWTLKGKYKWKWVAVGQEKKRIRPANRPVFLRRLLRLNLCNTLLYVVYRTAAASVLLWYCTLQGWQRQLRGHMESEKGYWSSDIGLSPGLLAVLEERMLAKLSIIICNDLHPSPWYAVSPVEDLKSLAHFTKLCQRAHQALSLPTTSQPYNTSTHREISSISCCQLGGCSEIFCMHNPPHTIQFRAWLHYHLSAVVVEKLFLNMELSVCLHTCMIWILSISCFDILRGLRVLLTICLMSGYGCLEVMIRWDLVYCWYMLY